MLAITYSMKNEIKVAKWGTPKKISKKVFYFKLKLNFQFVKFHFTSESFSKNAATIGSVWPPRQ